MPIPGRRGYGVVGPSALAVLCLTITSPAGPLHAQGGPTNASQRTQGASPGYVVDTIVPDSLATSPATRTSFSDLLQARVPGLSVERSSGITAAGAGVSLRGVNSYVIPETPLVIVDGVRVRGSTSASRLGDGRFAPSELDELNPEDIERVEVLEGPAAAARYGTGAANGVLLVTTRRRPAAGARVTAHATVGLLTETTAFPANFDQLGTATMDGSVVHHCGLVAQLRRTCTPTAGALLTINPLEERSPFSTSMRSDVGVSTGGRAFHGSYYVAGSISRETGVFDVNHLQRMNVYASAQTQLAPDLDLTLHAGYSEGALHRPIGNLLWTALTSEDTANQGYRTPLEELREEEGRETTRHIAGGAALAWTPAKRVAITARWGIDHLRERGRIVDSTGDGPSPALSRRSDDGHFEDQTARLSIRTWVPLSSSFRINVMTEAAYLRSRRRWATTEVDSGIVPGLPGPQGELGRSGTQVHFDPSIIGVSGQVELAWGTGRSLTAGVRHDHVSLYDDDDVPASSARASVDYPWASVSWLVTDEPWFPHTLAISRLQLRGAHGEAGQPIPEAMLAPPASRLGRVREAEFGIDLGLLHERITLGVTHYRQTTSTDYAIGWAPLLPLVGSLRCWDSGACETAAWRRRSPPRCSTVNPSPGRSLLAARYHGIA